MIYQHIWNLAMMILTQLNTALFRLCGHIVVVELGVCDHGGLDG